MSQQNENVLLSKVEMASGPPLGSFTKEMQAVEPGRRRAFEAARKTPNSARPTHTGGHGAVSLDSKVRGLRPCDPEKQNPPAWTGDRRVWLPISSEPAPSHRP
jgi:hypothetical protein